MRRFVLTRARKRSAAKNYRSRAKNDGIWPRSAVVMSLLSSFMMESVPIVVPAGSWKKAFGALWDSWFPLQGVLKLLRVKQFILVGGSVLRSSQQRETGIGI